MFPEQSVSMARIQLAKSALLSVLFKATASLDNSDRQIVPLLFVSN